MALGATNYDWEMRTQNYLNSRLNCSQNDYYNSDSSSVFDNQEQTTASLSNNVCTDGNDDGKIGFWGALTSMGKGAVKGVINGVKGCFTNAEGKFSLGKTLLTVGMGALCIAFPAVGAVACGVGAVMGGGKLISGVVNASNAKTDAAKKDAFENIGDGALTVVSSAVGAKASVGAVKSTSTAAIDDVAKAFGSALDKTDDVANSLKGLSNTDDIINSLKGINNTDDVINSLKGVDNVDDAMRVIKSSGKMNKTSALDNLDDAAKFVDKAKALGKDMWSSTKNRAVDIKDLAVAANKSHKATKANKKLEEVYDSKSKKEYSLDETRKITDEAEKANSDYEATKKHDTIKKIKDGFSSKKKAWKDKHEQLDKAKKDITKAQDELVDAKKTNDTERIKIAEDKCKEANDAYTELNSDSWFSKLKQKRADKKTAKAEFKDTLKGKTLNEKFSAIKELKHEQLSKFTKSIPDKYQAVVKALTDGDKSYNQIVSEFGWTNVAEVLKMFQAYIKADSTL